MARSPGRTKQSAAAGVWRLMSDYLMAQFGRRAEVLQKHGLTPGHMKVLLVLEPGVARPMGACASALNCDASTATWLIDRLEERGLVERQPSATDRRVRAAVLTAKGVELKAEMERHFYAPPEGLLELDSASLESLRDTFTRLKAGLAPAQPSDA